MFNETNGSGPDRPGHAQALNLLARARPERLKALAEDLLEKLSGVTVIANRTGLVMVPMRDTVQNVDFHLGEVLVSEAHIADGAGRIGYGMVTGRDLERAMAMAVVDLALAAEPDLVAITGFINSECQHLAEIDAARMRRVEATRVEMETF